VYDPADGGWPLDVLKGQGRATPVEPSGEVFRVKKTLGLIVVILVSGTWMLSSQAAPNADLKSAGLLQYLNQTIGWYRQLDLQRQMATEPEEGMVVNENEQIANQVVSLAFDFARVQADAIEKAAAAGQAGERDETGAPRYQALRRMLASLDQQVRSNQTELDSLRQKLANETGRQRESLQARIDETRSELDLAQVRRDAIRSMAEFVGGSSAGGLGATGIREQIEALARSVPGALAKPATTPVAPGAATAPIAPAPVSALRRSEASGVWGLSVDVLALAARMRALRDAIQLTDALSQDLKTLRTPLVTTLRDLSKRGDELAVLADTSDPIVLVQQKAMFDALTAQFKRTSDGVLPLSKQGILLDLYQKNLTNWRESLQAKYATELRELLVRLGMLALLLAAIVGGAELWRRAIFGYVHDPRRRYQYLVLRKIVFWCVIAIVLVFSFASELSSVATFAGLITAGVAVALQSVILSVVAYFFLIGRYGIRVGDRVQVAGVTGEVVDVGLVRFHMIELVSGGEKTASGRVVAFSNSVVFQSSAGFFKQIPGTNFLWHEVTVTMSPDSDYLLAEERLRRVVETIFADYRDEMEKQSRHIEKTLTTASSGTLQPTSRLRPTASGLEVVIRYPVDLMHAAEIDDRVTRELLSVMDHEPALKQAGAGRPPLRLTTDISS
jgi:small-conductance mechanosensitive channel